MGNRIRKLDSQKAKRNPLYLMAQGLLLLTNRKHPFVIATAGPQRRKITMFLNRFNRPILKKSALIVMGGFFANRIKDDFAYQDALKQYRTIYVETNMMLDELTQLGFDNVAVYPNCRKRPVTEMTVASSPDHSQPLRCLFFSLVSPDKGADLILEAAKGMPDVQFDFYGEIDPTYKETFLQEIQQIPNAAYGGVFQVKGDNVYGKLNEYDVLLLPTKCTTEGVPGILVEAKIAAIASIVSHISYNSEIVEDGVSGIVLKENTVDDLVNSIIQLNQDRMLLQQLKHGALASAEQYYIDRYMDDFLNNLEEDK